MEKMANFRFSLVFPVHSISECDPIDSECISHYSEQNLEPKNSRYYGKKSQLPVFTGISGLAYIGM